MVKSGCDEQAACLGVGRVDEHLVIDTVGIRGAGDVDEPERVKATLKCPAIACLVGTYFCQGSLPSGVAMEGPKGCSLCEISSGLGCRCTTGCASPPRGAFTGGAIFLTLSLADGASGSILSHPR